MKSLPLTITLVAVLVVAGLNGLAAKTITVTTQANTQADYYLASGQPYTTLDALLQSADVAEGDVLHLLPSATDYGNVNITKGITLYGNGHYFQPQTAHARLEDLNVNSANVTVIGIEAEAVNVNTQNGNTSVTDFLLRKSHITGLVRMQRYVERAHFEGNLFAGNIEISSTTQTQTDIIFSNNLMTNNANLDIKAAGSGVTKNVLFVNNTFIGDAHQNPSYEVVRHSIFLRNVFAGWQFNTDTQGSTFYHNLFTTTAALPAGNTGSATDNVLNGTASFENTDGNHTYNYGNEDLRLTNQPYTGEVVGITDSYNPYGTPVNANEIDVNVVNPVVSGTDPVIITITDNQQ